MDAPAKDSSSALKKSVPPKKKRSLARLLGMSLLALIVIGVVAAIAIRTKNQADKRRNLEDTVLQELKQPHKIALDAIAADSGAKAALGDDIQDDGGLGREGTGELDGTGTVIHFDVTGSKGKGRVTAPAALQQGAWQITGEIEIKLTDGKTIKVARPSDKPPDIDLGF